MKSYTNMRAALVYFMQQLGALAHWLRTVPSTVLRRPIFLWLFPSLPPQLMQPHQVCVSLMDYARIIASFCKLQWRR